jgi:hypothetical protein
VAPPGRRRGTRRRHGECRSSVALGPPEGVAEDGVAAEIGKPDRVVVSLGHDRTSWFGLEPGGKFALPPGSLFLIDTHRQICNSHTVLMVR